MLKKGMVLFIVFIGLFAVLLTYQPAITTSAPIYQGDETSKQVAFLVNVAWGEEYLPSILAAFEESNSKATFFFEGRYAENHPYLVTAVAKEAHEIGNHGYSHKDHSVLDYSGNLKEIKDSELVLEEILGEEVTLFAPPSGAFNEETIKACNDLDLECILWTVDTVDWMHPGKDKIIDKISNNLQNGALILMHPTIDMVEALPELLSIIKDEGYTIATCSDTLLGTGP